MEQVKRRGLLPEDDRFFAPAMLPKLSAAREEVRYLLDRGYPMHSALSFVGNHHQLSSRQQVALGRTTDSAAALERRRSTRLDPSGMSGQTAHIDGLNLIITLEVALSDGMLFRAQDDVIRDLAALRGTYRLIPQTRPAIAMLRDALADLDVSGAIVYLDAPVSNSGKLKAAFFEESWPIPLAVELVRNPDAILKTLGGVFSGDAIILDHCDSWFNAVAWILETRGMLPTLSRLIPVNP